MTSTSPPGLLGTWRLERTIDDRLAHAELGVVGTTVLDRVGDRIRWHEQGLLGRTDGTGTPSEVHRTLYVVPPTGPEPGSWWVLFGDGRPFHPWTPGVEVEHPCGPDLYAGLVEVHGPDAWQVTWHCTGPAKDYTMCSRLTREDGRGRSLALTARRPGGR